MAKVLMIKKNPCPYCDRAKNLLDRKGIPFEVIDLTDNYTDLKALDEEGKLDELVKA